MKEYGIYKFLNEFLVNIKKDDNRLIEIKNRFYLINKEHKKIIENTKETYPYYIGDYVGKSTKDKFIPSLRLLDLFSDTKFKTIVNKKSSWLFLCGRDVFPKGIIKANPNKSDLTLIVDEQNNILGYGKLSKRKDGFFIKNLLDKGDFLRREMNKKNKQ